MKIKALRFAFPHTLPIMAGFLFLGAAYGIYMNVSGFSFLYPFFMSFVIFGGSLEFVTAQMLLGPFAPVQTFFMALLIQARHLFYGLSMLDKFKGLGVKKYYMIYAMCDESFSVNFSMDVPQDIDRGWAMFFVTLLNELYWVTGAVIGALAGSLITFDTSGIEFVMTAMFVVIFLDSFLKEKNHFSSILGLAAPALCLVIFGADSFMIPSMALIILMLTIFKKPLERSVKEP